VGNYLETGTNPIPDPNRPTTWGPDSNPNPNRPMGWELSEN